MKRNELYEIKFQQNKLVSFEVPSQDEEQYNKKDNEKKKAHKTKPF